MQILVTLVAGILFGLGLAVSGLINPAKVLNFLDIAGAWDPSLAFTMGGAVVTTAIGYKLAFARGTPLTGDRFHIPATRVIDAKLLSGAALFGVGWGLVGYCPGPAIAAVTGGGQATLIFIVAMLVGMAVARGLAALAKPAPATH